MNFIDLIQGNYLSICETPEGLRRLENVTSASIDIGVSGKWVKLQFRVNYPFKETREGPEDKPGRDDEDSPFFCTSRYKYINLGLNINRFPVEEPCFGPGSVGSAWGPRCS